MPRIVEEPQVRPANSPGDERGDTITSHPAFGVVGLSRRSGAQVLYGSDFIHRNTVCLKIAESEVKRSLSHDWYQAKNFGFIEIEMSEAQFASLIANWNQGEGVPCTITMREGRRVPEIPEPVRRHEQFDREVMKRLERAETALKGLVEGIRDDKHIPKTVREELWSTLLKVQNNLSPNVTFVGKSFAEHVERTTEHAKVEIEAALAASVQRLGLAGVEQLKRLVEGEGEFAQKPFELPERKEE